MEGGIGTLKSRIEEVRNALAEILPEATRSRRVGLITYGTGPGEQCNVRLELKPTANASSLIMRDIEALSPAGKTPLVIAGPRPPKCWTIATSPGMIVVVTDGEETCGASPCTLGKELRAAAAQLTVHIIGFRMKDYSWIGEHSISDAKCLAKRTTGSTNWGDWRSQFTSYVPLLPVVRQLWPWPCLSPCRAARVSAPPNLCVPLVRYG
jgi:Ca-activated chloride channel family protein